MRHEDQRSGIAEQKVLEPLDGFEIEMVRGLVQQQEVGIGHDRFRHQHAALHSRRERVKEGRRVEGHSRNRGLNLPVELPGRLGLEFQMQLVQLALDVVTGMSLRRQGQLSRDKHALSPQTGGHDVENRVVGA